MSDGAGRSDARALSGQGCVVIVPTYNEIDNVDHLLGKVLAVLPDAGILVVDDNSPDGTADSVDAYAASNRVSDRVRVLRRGNKEGLGAAYRAGFAEAIAAGAEICVQMDADLSHDPVYLPEVLAAVVMGADVSIGSRYTPGGRIENWPPVRRFLSRWGNRFAAGMLGLAVNDATSGYRAYSRNILQRMDYATVGADGYGFQVEMTHRAVRRGARVVEIPILFVDRLRGESKLTYHIIGEAFGLVVRLWFRDRFLNRRYRRR